MYITSSKWTVRTAGLDAGGKAIPYRTDNQVDTSPTGRTVQGRAPLVHILYLLYGLITIHLYNMYCICICIFIFTYMYMYMYMYSICAIYVSVFIAATFPG